MPAQYHFKETLSPLGASEKYSPHHTRSYGNATYNSNTHETVLGHLIVYQPFQTFGL